MNHLNKPPAEEFFRPEALVVRLLLALSGLSQARLAQRAGVAQALVSLYQRGKLVPQREVLESLAVAAGWPLAGVESMATTALRVRELPQTLDTLDLASPVVAIAHRVALELETAVLEISALVRTDSDGPTRASTPSAEDPVARRLWDRLERLDARERWALVQHSRAFHDPSLALLLAREGERRATEGAAEAGQLVQLSRYVASLCLPSGLPS